MDKDMKKLIRALKAQGFEVEISKRGHPMVYREGRLVATFSGTSSDWRAMKNGIARVRRAGFRWPP